MVARCAACPEARPVRGPPRPPDVGRRRLAAAADARWRLGQKKTHQQWRWSAMDAPTRQRIAL